MRVALRALLLLAAVMPLFAATAFHPALWQTFVAAALGSALGQLAVWLARERRVAQWAVAGVAAMVIIGSASWPFVRTRHDAVKKADVLVVSGKSLTQDDVQAIETLVPSAERVVSYRSRAEQVLGDDQNWNTRVIGTTNDYFDLMELRLAAGERFDTSGRKVAVLGETVATQLFGAHASAVGAIVRVKNMPFEVIGVLAHRGTTALGQDLDDVALVPLDVFTERLAPKLQSSFDGVLLLKGDLPRVEADVRRLLRERHRIDPTADDDFTLRRP